jgi:hypothetical protein
MTAIFALPLEEALSDALAEAEGDVGDAAPAMLFKAYAHVAARASDGYLPAQTLLRMTTHRSPKKVVAALVEAGSLRPQGKGFLLVHYLEANPSRAQREASKAAERERKRKPRGAEAPPEGGADSRVDSGTDSGPESGVEGGADSGLESGASSQTLLSQGENSPREFTPGFSPEREGSGPEAGLESTPEAPPPSRPEPRAESRRPSAPPSAAAPRTPSAVAPVVRPADAEIPGLAVTTVQLAAAYAAGISQATGQPCSPPTEKWNLSALKTMARTHAGGAAGQALLAWVTRTATEYVTACREVMAHSSKNFSSEKCSHWLDGGRAAAPSSGTYPSRPSRVAPAQPADPGPATPAFKPLAFVSGDKK